MGPNQDTQRPFFPASPWGWTGRTHCVKYRVVPAGCFGKGVLPPGGRWTMNNNIDKNGDDDVVDRGREKTEEKIEKMRQIHQ